MKPLTIRSPKTLGCTVISTVLLQSLRERFPDSEIHIYTETPDLFEGLNEVTNVFDSKTKGLDNYDINLKDYLEDTKPQESLPLRHLVDHMFEVTERQLGNKLDKKLNRDFQLKINLTEKEKNIAKSLINSVYKEKPVIWLQTTTSTSEKNWPKENWQQLIEQLSDNCTFIELTPEKFTRRESIAITKYCDAGIVLDSFLLHGSEAVHAQNTIVILVSTHPEVVTYRDQFVLEQPSIGEVVVTLKNLVG